MWIASVKGYIKIKDSGPYPIKQYQMIQPIGYGRIQILKSQYLYRIVHYDTCDLSSTFLHGVKLGPERSEGPNYAVQSAP